MQIVLVVAMAQNRVIGVDGDLPWKISADLKHFKAVTMGHPVIMGRKTYESIGKPLPGRDNIVITRNDAFAADGIERVSSIEDALDLCRSRNAEKAMIIGGGQIYAETINLADVIELTEVHAEIKGDTVFPEIDGTLFEEVARERFADDGEGTPAYSFVTLQRR